MEYKGRYKFSFSKVPGKVMENEFTIAEVSDGKFTGFMHNRAGDHPIEGTLDGGNFAFDFAGGHKHAEQEGAPPHGGPGGPPAGGPPAGGPPAGGPPAGGPPAGGPPAGGPPAGGPPHGGPGGPPPGEPLVMHFAGSIAEDGSLTGTLTVLQDVTAIQGAKL